MNPVIFISLLMFYNTEGHLQPLLDEKTSKLSLSQCVADATSQYFDDELTFSFSSEEIAHNQHSSTTLSEILLPKLFQRFALYIHKATFGQDFWELSKLSDGHIIQLRNLEELGNNLRYLQWNSLSKFLIVSSQIYNHTDLVATYIFEELETLGILTAIVMLLQASNPQKVDIFSWYPYSRKSCGKHVHDVHIIDSCQFGAYRKNVSWFSHRIPNNLNKCPVVVRVVVWPPYIMHPTNYANETDTYTFTDGLEIKLMNTIAKHANFEVIYTLSSVPEDFGVVNWNGSTTGSFAPLRDGSADIAMSSFTPYESRMFYFDTSVTYLEDSLMWCVPHAKTRDPFDKLANIFPGDVQILFVTAFGLCSLVIWRATNLFPKAMTKYTSFWNIVQELYSMSLGNAVPRLPKNGFMRVVIVTWLFFAFLMHTLYTTFLMSSLTNPSYDNQIQSLQDILSGKLDILLIPNLERFMRGDNWEYRQVLKKYKSCLGVHDCLNRTAFQRDSAVAVSRLYMKYVMHKFITPEEGPLIYCFKENIVSFPVVMYMSKHFPLKRRIDDIIWRIQVAGLLQTWEKDILNSESGKLRPNKGYTSDNVDVSLRFCHFQAAFMIYVVGNGFACLVFTIELLTKNRTIMGFLRRRL